MEQKFKYKSDKRARRLTIASIIVIIAALIAILLLVGDSYLRAWLIATFAAVVLLYVLSIPRYLKVTDEAVEIHCIVELTKIAIADISSVTKVERGKDGRLLLLLGSYGFFGYYGYYLNLRHWETVKVYATELHNLIEIEDIYEQKYLVSCNKPDRFIEMVMQAKLEQAGEEESLI
jgi:Mn2+/Fe2+ NRAMP family transporter